MDKAKTEIVFCNNHIYGLRQYNVLNCQQKLLQELQDLLIRAALRVESVYFGSVGLSS